MNRFVDAVLADAEPADREAFVKGLTWVDERSRALFKHELRRGQRRRSDRAPHEAVRETTTPTRKPRLACSSSRRSSR